MKTNPEAREWLRREETAIKADPLMQILEKVPKGTPSDILMMQAVKGIPISEMPEEWKDGRKVLVFGEYQMQIDGHTIRDEPKWHGAKFDEHDEVWFPLNPDAKSYCCIEASHFLPYPADPK